MPGQQVIIHKITKITGRNQVFIFHFKKNYFKKNYYSMKNHVQLNPIIADFKKIDIIW